MAPSLVDMARRTTMGIVQVKQLLIILLLVLGTGCAARAVHEVPESLGFIKVSQGTGRGITSVFTGNAKYCMVELFNVEGLRVESVSYNNGDCIVNWSAADGLR